MKVKIYLPLTIITLLYLASCTPKGMPKTSGEIQEDFSAYRNIYQYKKPVFEGEGMYVRIPYQPENDILGQYSITKNLNEFLDYIPPEVVYIPWEQYDFQGYRIQIYRGTSRQDAERAKQRSYQLYPRITPYLVYRSPTYRVLVGDFLESREYINIYNTLKREFPMAMVVPATVKITVMGPENN